MKILFVVCLVGNKEKPGAEMFTLAWDNFMKYHRSEIKCDVKFVATKFNHAQLKTFIKSGTPWDIPDFPEHWYLNFPVIAGAVGYDYVIRIDHDAFVSVNTINSIVKFLEDGPEIDLAYATNSPRIINFSESKNAQVVFSDPHPLNPNTKTMLPWGIPNNNGDLIVLRRDFYLKVCERMNALVPGHSPPKAKHHMMDRHKRYGEVCDMLGFKDKRITPADRNAFITVDGMFHGDAWATVCSMKPRLAGIVDMEGRSFCKRNNLSEFADVMQNFSDYWSVRDEVDISFPLKHNIKIDHLFHTESGYVFPWLFNSFKSGQIDTFAGVTNSFKKPARNRHIAMYAIAHLLTKRLSPQLHTMLVNNINKLCNQLGSNVQLLERYTTNISEFYTPALKDYIR